MAQVNNAYYTTLVSSVAALGGLLFGFDTAVISGTIPYITAYFGLSEYALGWAVGCILIGCALGALVAGKLADKFGRRPMLMVCAVLFAASGIGAGLAGQLWVFVVFRLVGGLGVGAAALISPMYISETAPAHLRGRLVSLYQLAIVSGILLAYFSNYLFDSAGENNWRWMFASQVLPSLLFYLLLLGVPETPRWLVGQGRQLQAKIILEKINGREKGNLAWQQMTKHAVELRPATALSVFHPSYRNVLLVGIAIAVFQQVTGINAILYYAPVIFKATGLSASAALLQTIGIGVINVVATFIAIGLVDKVGRKKFLLYGSALMGFSLLAVAACFYLDYFDHYLVLIFTLLYVAAFGCTLGAVTWVYLSEIFPGAVRAAALSVATLTLWLADFAVTYTFPVMTQHLGTACTLLVYAGCCLLCFVFVYSRVKETRGRTLEDIESLFIK